MVIVFLCGTPIDIRRACRAIAYARQNVFVTHQLHQGTRVTRPPASRLGPIINGVGNYYIEAETREQTRLDMVIDYLGKQYVIEMKIWRGNAYNERGREQLLGYLDHFHLDKGYLVSFCFNKNKKQASRRFRWMMDGRSLRRLFDGAVG